MEGPFQDANGVPTRVTPATKIVFDEVVSSSSSYINRDDHPAGVSATADGVELTWMAEPGAYSVCLDNSMSQMQTKVKDGRDGANDVQMIDYLFFFQHCRW